LHIWIFPQNLFGLLWKVSGCRGLLVTATPFPRVHANAESILRNLCCLASILHNDNFLKESGCQYKNLGKQFPDHFKRRPYV